jgi:hypothetical protein
MLLDPKLGKYRAIPSDQDNLALQTAVEKSNVGIARLLIDPDLGEDRRADPSFNDSIVL